MNSNHGASRVLSAFSVALKRDDIGQPNRSPSYFFTKESVPPEEIPEPAAVELSGTLKENTIGTIDSEISFLKQKYGIGPRPEKIQHNRTSSLDMNGSLRFNFKKLDESEFLNQSYQVDPSQKATLASTSSWNLPEFDKPLAEKNSSDYQLLLRRFHKMEDFYKEEIRILNDELDKYRSMYYKLKYRQENSDYI